MRLGSLGVGMTATKMRKPIYHKKTIVVGLSEFKLLQEKVLTDQLLIEGQAQKSTSQPLKSSVKQAIK
jgi:hypothetical protein